MRFLYCALFFAAIAPAQDTTTARFSTPVSAPDPVSAGVRANRDSLFNFPAKNLPALSSEPSGMPPRVVTHNRPNLSELPVESADTILVGAVGSITSRVASSKALIYSEYTVNIENSLKLPTGLSEPNSIDVLQDGGAVTDDKGHLLRNLSTGMGAE